MLSIEATTSAIVPAVSLFCYAGLLTSHPEHASPASSIWGASWSAAAWPSPGECEQWGEFRRFRLRSSGGKGAEDSF